MSNDRDYPPLTDPLPPPPAPPPSEQPRMDPHLYQTIIEILARAVLADMQLDDPQKSRRPLNLPRTGGKLDIEKRSG